MSELSDPQARLLPLLLARKPVQEIVDVLGWSRAWCYQVMDQLGEAGWLRPLGELPSGAVASVGPPHELFAAWHAVFPLLHTHLGWAQPAVGRLVKQLARFGLSWPETVSRGFTGERWTGEFVRRVDLAVGDTVWCVQGLLVSRPDGKWWGSATPDVRVVVVTRDPGPGDRARTVCWLSGRELVYPWTETRAHVPMLSASGEVALTLAVAWVLGSRALLDVESRDVEA